MMLSKRAPRLRSRASQIWQYVMPCTRATPATHAYYTVYVRILSKEFGVPKRNRRAEDPC